MTARPVVVGGVGLAAAVVIGGVLLRPSVEPPPPDPQQDLDRAGTELSSGPKEHVVEGVDFDRGGGRPLLASTSGLPSGRLCVTLGSADADGYWTATTDGDVPVPVVLRGAFGSPGERRCFLVRSQGDSGPKGPQPVAGEYLVLAADGSP